MHWRESLFPSSAASNTPPFLHIDGFLSAAGAQSILGELIGRRAEFRARGSNRSHPTFYRMITPLAPPAEFLRRFERLAPLLEWRFGIALGIPEIELLGQAYNECGSFGKHSDAAAGGPNWQRRLSGIYYLHVEPKKFAGGALAIYHRRRRYVVEPDHNSAIFFPPNLIHEVLPVSCSSGAFEHSRFAINVWIS
jgi:Rps23 Pro-64 3,4-dihydroxylase Tpa1-like proline 4-hydroxylase